MPGRAFVIRFPNGDFEYDVSRRPAPTVGETVRRHGALWWVARVTDEDVPTAYVEPIKGFAPVEPRDPDGRSSAAGQP